MLPSMIHRSPKSSSLSFLWSPLSRSEIDEDKRGHPFSVTRIRDPVCHSHLGILPAVFALTETYYTSEQGTWQLYCVVGTNQLSN
jgi:hypothetical protein